MRFLLMLISFALVYVSAICAAEPQKEPGLTTTKEEFPPKELYVKVQPKKEPQPETLHDLYECHLFTVGLDDNKRLTATGLDICNAGEESRGHVEPWLYCMSYPPLYRDQLFPALGAIYKVTSLDAGGMTMTRVGDETLLKKLASAENTITFPIGGEMRLSPRTLKLPEIVLDEKKKINVAKFDLETDTRIDSFNVRGVHETKEVRVGDQCEFVGRKLVVLKIVPQDKIRGIIGWVEFEPQRDEPKLTLISRLPEAKSEVDSVAFSNDDGLFFSAGSEGVITWDAKTLAVNPFNPGRKEGLEYMALIPANRMILADTANEHLEVWDFAKQVKVTDISEMRRSVTAIEVSHDGKYLFAGTGDFIDGKQYVKGDYAIHMYDLSSGKELRKFQGHINRIRAIAASRDGKLVASYSEDRTCRLWDIETAKEVRRFGSDDPAPATQLMTLGLSLVRHKMPLLFSPDGKFLMFGLAKWSVPDWKELIDFEKGEELGIWRTVISEDGKRLFCGHHRGDISLWDFETGKLISRVAAFPISQTEVLAVAISKDGKYALAGGRGKAVQRKDDGYRVGLWRLPD